MLTDKQIDKLIEPILNLYSMLEYDLMLEVASYFENAGEVSGILEWQLKKLNELGGVNVELLRLIEKHSELTEAQILDILNKAGYANIDMSVMQKAFNKGMITVDPDRLMQTPTIRDTINLSYKELSDTYKLINTRALESAKQSYMDIVNTSYLDVASGMHSLQESVKEGVRRMADKGFTAATYRRGGKTVTYSIESVVRRDTITAVHQLANKASEQACKEIGAEYVEISKHLGARVHPTNPIANHAGWQGEVFKLEGSDEKYKNLKEATGYPDDIQGLGGVNCRHRMFPYFPGISVKGKATVDDEENLRVYKATQHQRKLEREIRKLKKQRACANAIDDKDGYRLYDFKVKEKIKEIDAFCEKNGLRRDPSRELVSEKIKKKTIANFSENDTISARHSTNSKTADSYSSLEYVKKVAHNPENVQKMVDDFATEHAYSDVEYARVLTKNGKLYSVKGTMGTVDIESFIPKNELNGATVIHNHPVPKGEKQADAFSFQDLEISLKCKTAKEYLATGEKRYAFSFNSFDISLEKLKKKYIKAKYRVWEKALSGDIPSGYRMQLETIKTLSELEDWIEFYEL